jgi:hypothetical protein
MSTARHVFTALVLTLAAMVVVVLGVGYLLAKDWHVRSERTVPATAAQVGALVRDLSTWGSWAKIDIQLGPQTARAVQGPAGQVGQRIVWTGSRGKAVLETVALGENSLDYTVGFDVAEAPSRGRGRIEWEAAGAQCTVRWRDEGSYDNVILRWFGWFGALQERVKQMQSSTFAGLERELASRAATK